MGKVRKCLTNALVEHVVMILLLRQFVIFVRSISGGYVVNVLE